MNVTTWAVLSDGKYIKILYNTSEHAALLILNADKHEAFAELCYKVVNNKDKGDTSVPKQSSEQDYIQLQADFLAEQQQAGAFDRLVLVAPQTVLQRLRAALPESVNALIAAELAEDLLPQSNSDIEEQLASKMCA